MCTAPKVDTTAQDQMLKEAEEARKREEERQARIRTGTAKIDTTFGGFDDNFYKSRSDAVMALYNPQLAEKFGLARDDMTYALARAGTLNSTMAADRQGRLQRDLGVQQAQLLSKAAGEENALRQRVGQEKSALVSQLNATGDADRASNDALARTQIISTDQPTFTPLGDIFAGASAGIGSYIQGQNNAAMLNAFYGNSARRGASRVVG